MRGNYTLGIMEVFFCFVRTPTMHFTEFARDIVLPAILSRPLLMLSLPWERQDNSTPLEKILLEKSCTPFLTRIVYSQQPIARYRILEHNHLIPCFSELLIRSTIFKTKF
jgi:hypothetical protein